LVLFAPILHPLSVKHVRVDAAQNGSIKNQSCGAFFDEPFSAGSARISMRRMGTFATKGFSMPSNALASSDSYVLATGAAAVRRLHVLHDVYAPAGKRVLLQAGLTQGMRVADFGCGVGVVTRMLAQMVGPSGSVTGIDVDEAQLKEAAALCDREGLQNTCFVKASAYSTGLPRNSFDLVYCRFLLLHLTDPAACLHEMRALLRPGGMLVVEDGDLASATSVPRSAMDAFAELFGQLGPTRGVNYSLAKDLYHTVVAAGFRGVNLEIHQPAIIHGENRYFLKWSVEEAGPALVEAGILTERTLARRLAQMQSAVDNPNVVILAPRMSCVWGRKADG
jgi:SAM-dependent methyltransferase